MILGSEPDSALRWWQGRHQRAESGSDPKITAPVAAFEKYIFAVADRMTTAATQQQWVSIISGSSRFGVGSQFGPMGLVRAGSVAPNWALTPILRAIGGVIPRFGVESELEAKRLAALIQKAPEAIEVITPWRLCRDIGV